VFSFTTADIRRGTGFANLMSVEQVRLREARAVAQETRSESGGAGR